MTIQQQDSVRAEKVAQALKGTCSGVQRGQLGLRERKSVLGMVLASQEGKGVHRAASRLAGKEGSREGLGIREVEACKQSQSSVLYFGLDRES